MPSLFKRWRNYPERFQKLFRFSLIGVSTSGIDYAVYRLSLRLWGLRLDPILGNHSIAWESIANALGMVVGFVFSFTMNKLWSFRSRQRTLRQLTLCVLLFLINLWVTGALIALLTRSVGFSPQLAKLICMALVVIWNYWLYSHVIFIQREPTQ